MSVFTLHSNVLADYRDFVRSFFSFADDRAREFIDRELVEQARLWPEALLQVSPSYARVASVDELATRGILAALDESFFRVRFDRLTPVEKRYLRAMGELGPGPHRSGDIAEELGRQVTSLGPTRNQLISKGMIWSPSHGDTAFTVPLFDEFMRRIMPDDDWRE